MGGGVYVYTWLILTNKHCRAITLQLKKVTQCSFFFSYFSHYSCLLLNVPHPCFGSQMKGKAAIVTYFEGMRLQTGYLIFVRKPLTPRILTLLIRRFWVVFPGSTQTQLCTAPFSNMVYVYLFITWFSKYWLGLHVISNPFRVKKILFI